jgi:hypothetical protein
VTGPDYVFGVLAVVLLLTVILKRFWDDDNPA